MKLSIIIVNYNSAVFLDQCLESLSSPDGIPSDWEVIIVDNASKESIEYQVSRVKEKTKSNILLIENEKNVGFATANNQGIKKSIGEYVLLLNPDTVVSQKTFQHLIDFIEKNEKAGVVTPKVLLANGELDDASHRGFPTPWRAFCYFSGLSSLFPSNLFFNGYHLGYRNMDTAHQIESCVGACMLIRRKVGDQVDWLDEDYFWYGEDLDFCYRVKEKGYEVWYVPEVSITHYKGVTSGIKKHSENVSTADAETRKNAQRARFEAMEIFYRKHYQKKYPSFITFMVNKGINLLKRLFC